MFEIISGNIAAGIAYQVIGGTSVTYNTIVYLTDKIFIGVSGVTTYSASGGSIVTEASGFNGSSIGFDNDFFLDHFSDDSMFYGQSAGFSDVKYYPDNITVEEIVQNAANFIEIETKIRVPDLIPEIVDIVGTALFEGVTFDELIQLEIDHAEIVLTVDVPNNITKMVINGINVLFTTD